MDVARILDSLETLRLDELRQVEARARVLIDRIAEWQQPAPTVEELERAPGGCYRLEYVRCGKERCKTCADGGQGHGPYWYRYSYRGGRVRKTYVGKERPDQ